MKPHRRMSGTRPGVRLLDSRLSHFKGLAEIVSDPDAVGGFAPGAVLSAVPQMLKMSAFSLGTIIKVDGRRMRVREMAGGGQWLERL